MPKYTPVLLLAVAITACESGKSAQLTDPLNQPGGFSLSVSKTTVSTPRGWNAIVDVDVVRVGGFTGAVDLVVEGIPAKVDAQFTPNSVSALATSARLSIEVDSTAVIGQYPLVVRGTSAGVTQASTGVQMISLQNVRGDDTRADVFLMVGPNAPAGSYPITIRATGTDVEPRTGTVNVVFPGP